MLTGNPNIVIAKPPKRNRARPRPAAVPARRMVDHRKGADAPEDDPTPRTVTAEVDDERHQA
jgi:hypothetical protein